MTQGQSNRMRRSASDLSHLLRRLSLLCLLPSLTACTVLRGPADRASIHVTEQASEAPPAAETPPAPPPPAPAAEAPPAPDAIIGRRPPPASPWSGAWSGTSGLFGNLGKLFGSIGNGGTLRSDNDAPPPGATHVTVYYATDRKYQPSSRNFGWQPNRVAPYLSYGSVVVSIPEKRAPGELPLPPWYAILSGDNVQKYVLIKGSTRLSRADFLAAVKARIRAAPQRHAAFIYIHGYSNSFDDAARRTAQMAVGLDIGALPVFYSWPSKGTLAGYEFDENAAE